MSTSYKDLLVESFDRINDELPEQLSNLIDEQLLWRPTADANSIGWLVWHIARCEDAQMAALTGTDEVYSNGWQEKLDLPYDKADIGYGHSSEQVDAFDVMDSQVLLDYYAAVYKQTKQILDGLSEEDLGKVIPNDPYEATVGVRIVSILNDITQHFGQIAYVRGMQAA